MARWAVNPSFKTTHVSGGRALRWSIYVGALIRLPTFMGPKLEKNPALKVRKIIECSTGVVLGATE